MLRSLEISVYEDRGDNFDKYTVLIGKHIYKMSLNADSPQGCCYYCGTILNMEYLKKNATKVPFDVLPEPVKNQIDRLK